MNEVISKLISMGLFKFLGIGAIGALIWYAGPYIDPLKPIPMQLQKTWKVSSEPGW